jgi:hypothetical protein
MEGGELTDWPIVCVLLVTYKRTELAVRTVLGVRKYLQYPPERVIWHIADDGSSKEHIQAIQDAIGVGHGFTNAKRRGVGVSQNMGMDACLQRADYILWLEDDWELVAPFDLTPCVRVLAEREDIGMVRLGYISPGITGTLISGAGRLWWKLDKGPTYTFTGHAALRHRRFCEAYGHYTEWLAPGATELHYCGHFNGTPGPAVVVPAFTGEWGPFGHIGGESLKDVVPQ